MLHGVRGVVPLIEIANDRDRVGVGSPDREAHTLKIAVLHQMRTQHAVAFVMRALGVEMQFKGCQGRCDGGCLHTAIMALDAAAS